MIGKTNYGDVKLGVGKEVNLKQGGFTTERVCYHQSQPRLVNRPGVAGVVLQIPT